VSSAEARWQRQVSRLSCSNSQTRGIVRLQFEDGSKVTVIQKDESEVSIDVCGGGGAFFWNCGRENKFK